MTSAAGTRPEEWTTSFDPDVLAIPTTRDEAWRFTPLSRVRKLFTPLPEVDGSRFEVRAPDWVTDEGTPTGPVVPGEFLIPRDLPSALAWSLASPPTLITVPAGRVVDEPIRVVFTGAGDSYGNLRITIEADARATVILDFGGSGDHVTNVEIETGPRSRLTLAGIHDWDATATHLTRFHTNVGREASVTQLSVTTGGSLVRSVSTVGFDGPGGQVELLGLSLADTGQHREDRLFIDHSAPHCRSNALHKGVFRGDGARGVWVGDVMIRPAAVRTETYETNRNLLLTAGARANSVPNLEIETGDVARAGHASATGRMDDEQLFYLQSRGLDPTTARALVVRGFLTGVVEKVEDERVRELVIARLEARLALWLGDALAGFRPGSGDRGEERDS